MLHLTQLTFCLIALFGLNGPDIHLDESPAKPGEWGCRPFDGQTVAVSPPSFVWRPMKEIVRWELKIDSKPTYAVNNLEFNVHTPPQTLPPGKYTWIYRGFDKNGTPTTWSAKRTFTVPENAKPMPLPSRTALLGRIPKSHPRIFVLPGGMGRLKELAKTELAADYKELVNKCDALLKNPPDTTEPPLYQDKKNWKQELDVWWGNRLKTIAVLENAALLAFVGKLDGNEQYAELSKKLLLAAAEWDPKGATGFRYNDEAGMPFAYHFARTYTFLNPMLSDADKERCRSVMAIRGTEMYKHLCPKQFWTPYESHANRAWHFLGEVGLAFHGEIPEAADWVWFAMNEFYATYPVWADDDGGWHEGLLYWNSYQTRFCWWADAMKAVFDINAFDKPYYSQIGFFPMYVAPPGKNGDTFGDLCNETKSRSNLELVDIVAMQSGNPYWRWYVDAHGPYKPPATYYTFLRKAAALDRQPVAAKPPTDLPQSKLFAGIGLAAMNTTILDAKDDVQVLFKSAPAPFGGHSHGYDANNSFIFSAWNESLLINSGRRDYYGSPHHRDWMWSNRSENNITVDGIGQLKRSNAAVGKIERFSTTPEVDVVVGEASEGFRDEKNERILDRFTRSVVFVKPDLLIVYDRLKAVKPSSFEYWLHAKYPFQPLDVYFPDGKSATNDAVFGNFLKEKFKEVKITEPEAVQRIAPITKSEGIGVRVDKAACRIDLLLPEKLEFTQTNQYDPNPQPKIKVREWTLTATTPEKKSDAEFLLVVRPWKVAATDSVPQTDVSFKRDGEKLVLTAVGGGKTKTITISETGNVVIESF